MSKISKGSHSHITPPRRSSRRSQRQALTAPVLAHYKEIKPYNYQHLEPPQLIKEEFSGSPAHQPLFIRSSSSEACTSTVSTLKESGTIHKTKDTYTPRIKLERIHPKRISRVIGNGLFCKEGKNRLAGEALFSRVHIEEGYLVTPFGGTTMHLSPKDKHYYKTHFKEATHFATLDSMTVIDTYKAVSKGMPGASKANDCTFRKHLPPAQRKAVEPNTKIVKYKGKLYLQAIKNIKPYQEIYYEYGIHSYIEPAEKQGVMPTRDVVAKEYLKQHFCKICWVAFKTKQHLLQHLVVHSNSKDFQCDKCEKAYLRKSCLDRHIRTTHQRAGKSKRAACNKSKPMVPPKQHGAFSCDFCDRRFHFGSNLQKHLLLHAGIQKYGCKGCGKLFSQSSNRNRHQKICNKTDTKISKRHYLKCSRCPYRTLQKCNLERHLVSKHNQTGKKACTFCKKTFSSPSALAAHIWSHKGIKQFTCKECNKTFVQPQGLNRHIRRLHTKDRPYQCMTCHNTFVCPSDLKQHMRNTHKQA